MKALCKLSMVALMGAVASRTFAQDIEVTGSAYADYVTTRVFRGQILNRAPSIQPGADVTFGCDTLSGLTLGIWADLAMGGVQMRKYQGYFVDRYKIGEVDFTASYKLPVDVDNLTWSVGHTIYYYTRDWDNDREAGEDYEINTVLSYETCLDPTLRLCYVYTGNNKEMFYVEGGLSHTVPVTDDVDVTFGGITGVNRILDESSWWLNGEVYAEASWKFVKARLAYTSIFNWSGNDSHYYRYLSDNRNRRWLHNQLYGSVGVFHTF